MIMAGDNTASDARQEAARSPELLIASVLHLMAHYLAAGDNRASRAGLSRLIARHFQTLSDLPNLAPVLRGTCASCPSNGGCWPLATARALPDRRRPGPRGCGACWAHERRIPPSSSRNHMDIPKELRDCGLKATLPRRCILKLFLDGSHKHLNADEVYHHLRAQHIDLGMATVYRVLLQLCDAGILLRNHFEASPSVFELNEGEHHDHLICTRCGKMDEFVDLGIERRQQEVATRYGFHLIEHSLSLYGICAACTSAGPRSGGH
jgi:Fur family ferric uptake transcriptional regulator